MVTTLLYIASILIGGYTLFIKGFRSLLGLHFEMNTLMTIAVIGSAVIGQWAESATVVILFAISEVLETFSMDKARASIRSLIGISPKKALIRREGEELTVSVQEIRIDDVMIVKPGQKLAMDGEVIAGDSSINQAAITGESMPVNKMIGDAVFAGTLNEEGYLEVKVTKRVHDSTLSKIIQLVEEAQAERAPLQQFVDRFAKYYTPIIMILSVLVAVIPPLFFGASWDAWVYRGLALLVVGCPCALIISTPVAIVTAIGNAAKKGVLIKGGIYLEEAGRLSAIAFDKTGTLTKGVPQVTDQITFGEISENRLLAIVSAMEKGSGHPLATAIINEAEKQIELEKLPVSEFKSMTGKGIQAKVEGSLYYLGNLGLIREKNMSVPNGLNGQVAQLQNDGKTVMILASDSKVLGLVAVADEVREQSKKVMMDLQHLGIKRTVMITGDNQATAQAIGGQLGLTDIKAELLPDQKLEVIKSLRKDGYKVAMVGDGVNDAPALATANVGIAMGGAGTDTALETADIALMADDLSKLPFTIKLSRKTLGIIKQNIGFALIIKFIAILLIGPGWLTLWMAVFADMGATLIVTLNGLRLLRVRE